jgi:hypothetical protein
MSQTYLSWSGRICWAVAFAATSVIGCGQDEGARTYHVTGAIVQGGLPVPNVPVSVDDAANWTATTDVAGRFDIAGVSGGSHTMAVSTANADGSFSERRTALQVAADVNVSELVLPEPLALAPVVLNGTAAQLSWQATDASDFREYKLYRRDSPGIDEIAGELVYVSTTRDQTTFVDRGLLVGKTYYYRVYVMNELGRLGGSNIVSTFVDAANLIPDGDFEGAGAMSQWILDPEGAFTVDDTAAHGGASSLHLTKNTFVKLIEPITIQTDVAYDLTFYVKVHGTRTNIDDGWINVDQGSSVAAAFTIDLTAPAGSPRGEDVDWTQVSQAFNVTSGGAITIRLGSSVDDLWIDDLVLRPHALGRP